jgi:hypothetical protein
MTICGPVWRHTSRCFLQDLRTRGGMLPKLSGNTKNGDKRRLSFWPNRKGLPVTFSLLLCIGICFRERGAGEGSGRSTEMVEDKENTKHPSWSPSDTQNHGRRHLSLTGRARLLLFLTPPPLASLVLLWLCDAIVPSAWPQPRWHCVCILSIPNQGSCVPATFTGPGFSASRSCRLQPSSTRCPSRCWRLLHVLFSRTVVANESPGPCTYTKPS